MKSPLRALRQKLFTEGKLVRYLGYAVGEVVLIIVGILFALKINDWNEDRKAQEEFDSYVVQLKEDVKSAIESIASNSELMKDFSANGEKALALLDRKDWSSKELDAFEAGINRLGYFTRVQIHFGLLGDLLDGDKDTIGLDKSLSLKALQMESGIERMISSLESVYDRLDTASGQLNQFIGRGSLRVNRPPIYDIQHLRNSQEFKNTAYVIITDLNRAVRFSDVLSTRLQEFFAVLEEYE